MSSANSAVPTIRSGMTDARRHRLMTVIAATAATFVIWLIAHPVAGIELDMGKEANDPSRTIGAVSVVTVTAIAGLIGWASLEIFERLTARARTRWTACALLALFISFLGPLGAVTTSAAIALLSMHLAAGAILILGLRSTTSCHEPSSESQSS